MSTKSEVERCVHKYGKGEITRNEALVTLRHGLTKMDRSNKKIEKEIGSSELKMQRLESHLTTELGKRQFFIRAIAGLENGT